MGWENRTGLWESLRESLRSVAYFLDFHLRRINVNHIQRQSTSQAFPKMPTGHPELLPFTPGKPGLSRTSNNCVPGLVLTSRPLPIFSPPSSNPSPSRELQSDQDPDRHPIANNRHHHTVTRPPPYSAPSKPYSPPPSPSTTPSASHSPTTPSCSRTPAYPNSDPR